MARWMISVWNFAKVSISAFSFALKKWATELREADIFGKL